MRLTSCLAWTAGLVGQALGMPSMLADGAVKYVDPETGFTFTEVKAAYSLSANVVFRIAVPGNAVANQPFDIVLQVIAPSQVGWAGLAWGANMIRNPLTATWANGNSAQVSSRWATAHSSPSAYTGATYTRLTAGNRVNGTHWQLTIKCTGCTSWQGSSGGTTYLNPKGAPRLAFVWSTNKPSSPSSNTSTLPIHDSPAYPNPDFTQGQNANFADLVKKNGGSPSELQPNGTGV